MIRIGHRFMTGQVCSTSGTYDFDGYTDSSTHPPLVADDKHITVNAGKPFPSAAGKNAYWKFAAWLGT